MTRRASARRVALVVTTLLAAALACGKKGDPRPPLRPTPGTITGLRLAQRGDKVEIHFTAPRASTDGARLPVLEIELFLAQDEGRAILDLHHPFGGRIPIRALSNLTAGS